MGRNGILLLGVCLAALTVIIASCAPGQYTLQVAVEPPNAGRVLIEPVKPFYGHGELVSITAEPSTDFVFAYWREDGTVLDSSNPMGYTVTASHRITAYFVRQGQVVVRVPPPPPPTFLVYLPQYLIMFFIAIIILVVPFTLGFIQESKSATRRHRLAKATRWEARAIGLSGALLYLIGLFFLSTFSEAQQYTEANFNFGHAIIVLALIICIVSLWREWLAGVLLVLISFAVAIWYRENFPIDSFKSWLWSGGPAFLLAGVLFLLSWWLSRKTKPSALPPSPML